MQLIRQEALTARRKEDLGRVDLTAMRLDWAILGLLFALIIVMVTFGVLAHHHRRVQASGVLVSSLGLVDVITPTAGTVERLEVSPGQRVSEGALLGTVFVDVKSSSDVPVGSAVHALLLKQRDNRQLELAQVDAHAKSREVSIEDRLRFAQRQRAAIDAQRSVLKASLSEAHSFLVKAETAARGALSEAQLRSFRADVAQYKLKLSELDLRDIELLQQQTQTRAELSALEFETEQSKRASQREITELDQSLARNVATQRIELRAERAGVVGETLVDLGQSLRAGQSVLQIIPDGSELEAELWLPSEAMGSDMTGASVNLRFHAFPFRTFGLQQGRIKSIGKTAVAADKRSLSSSTNQSRFRVRVTLANQQLLATDGSQRQLLLGMEFDADLLLEKRPIYQFFWPEPRSYGAQR
jgi:membrane fusion protein